VGVGAGIRTGDRPEVLDRYSPDDVDDKDGVAVDGSEDNSDDTNEEVSSESDGHDEDGDVDLSSCSSGSMWSPSDP
jgi:hypothetical protein